MARRLILLTGSSGFLGRHVLSSLEKMAQTQILAPTRAELNLLDSESVSTFFSSVKPETVIHLAAKVGGIGANSNNNSEFLIENQILDMNVLGQAKRHGVKNLIAIGSSCVYPPSTGRALKEGEFEASNFEPTNEGYALAKYSQAALINLVRMEEGLNWGQFILSNLYGPGDNFSVSGGHLIAAIIQKTWQAKEEEGESISIWGDGTARREFTYVEDVASFISATVLEGSRLKPLMNLGYGRDYSVLEYYQKIGKAMNFEGKFEFDLSMPSGAKDKLMDSSEAMKMGWRPKVDLDSGINKTLDWYERYVRKQ